MVAEAMAWLAAARLLVGLVRFGRWRHLLGSIVTGPDPAPPPGPAARQLARAVRRGAERLPFATKCLPRAIALHAMLRRRTLPSRLALTVLEERHRGSIDDLHAWVESGGEILIGELELPFHPLVRFGQD